MTKIILVVVAVLFVAASAALAQAVSPDDYKDVCLDLTILQPDGQLIGINPLSDGQCAIKFIGKGYCKIVVLPTATNNVKHNNKNGYFIDRHKLNLKWRLLNDAAKLQRKP